MKDYLGSKICQQMISSLVRGAAQQHLSAANVKQFDIPLPPLEEQVQIAARLNGAEGIKKTNAESDKKIEELKSSLLQRAFRGEL